MPFRPEPQVAIHRRRERDGLPLDDRKLAKAIAQGEFVRIAPGSFARAAAWKTLTAMDRHHLRVVEMADRLHGPVTLCDHAAAAIHGIDTIGTWPARVDTLVPRRGGGRSTGLVRRRTAIDPDVQTAPWRGHFVTTPAQTAVDLARAGSFTDGVVALDQALWTRRDGGPLTDAAALRERLEAGPRRAGHLRAERAVEFATDVSDSVRETESRVGIRRLGFPTPELQKRFVLASGRVALTDFWWPEWEHVGEFDGVGKYLDPALRGDRTPEEALIDEKDRGDELRRMVHALSRWRSAALRDLRLLYDILTGDGLPSALPRPPAGLVLR